MIMFQKTFIHSHLFILFIKPNESEDYSNI